MRARRTGTQQQENVKESLKQIKMPMQYENTPLLNRLRQFFIFEVCRDEALEENGEFRCDIFSPRDKAEPYIIYDERSGAVVGYMLITQNTVSIGNGWHINEMLILPKYRNSGYGKKAVERLLEIHKRERIEVCPAEGTSEAFWNSMKNCFSGYDEDGFIILNNK